MKKIAIIINLVFILLCFNSCVGADALNEIAIVQSIGIDLLEDNTIGLTLQIYSPQGAGSNTAIDASKNNSSIIKTQGKTISNAIQNATTMQGKNIFTGNNRIIIVGKSFAEKSLEEMFSYFNRSALTRQNTQVLMAEGNASDIVGVNIYQGILAAQTIEEMIDNYKKNGIVYECPYYWLTKNMALNDGAGAMPIIKIEKDGENNAENTESEQIQTVNKVRIDGTAIFSEYKLANVQDTYNTRGMLLLEDRLKETIININDDDMGIVSVKVYESSSNLKPVIENGKLSYKLDVNLKGILKEILYPQGKQTTEEAINSIEDTCENEIKQEIDEAYYNVVNINNSDILNLDSLALKYQTNYYIQNKENIKEIIFDSDLITNISLKIDRIGLENS